MFGWWSQLGELAESRNTKKGELMTADYKASKCSDWYFHLEVILIFDRLQLFISFSFLITLILPNVNPSTITNYRFSQFFACSKALTVMAVTMESKLQLVSWKFEIFVKRLGYVIAALCTCLIWWRKSLQKSSNRWETIGSFIWVIASFAS